MVKLLWLVVAICSSAWMIESYKILVVFPMPAKSHDILGEAFVRILLNAGHEVTYVTPFPKKDTKTLKYIDVSANLKVLGDLQITNLTANFHNENDPMMLSDFQKFSDLLNSSFTSEQMQQLIYDPNAKFDLVLIEWMFSEFYSGLAAVFDCPFIWYSSVNPHTNVLQLIDQGLNPSFNPHVISSNVPPFDFKQRVQELLSNIVWSAIRTIILLPPEKQYYYDIFGPVLEKRGRPLPSYEEMIYKASFMFGNSHVSTARAMSLPDNYKHIAGYHIDPKVKPLPEDLKKIIESAKDGVIYFSLGSNIKSKDFPTEMKKRLLKMFGSLKYTVLWKFEEQLSGLPNNVHILQWAPQPSILSHPNCKLFITHGGLLSTIETIHFGVPVIGIPIFADQFVNVEAAKQKGYALRVDLSYEMADELKVAIEEIIGNPIYKQKIDELNFIFHDRPVPPATEVVHWVNHVIRTKGAPHFRSGAVMMPWYQKYYVDFLALVLFVSYIVVMGIKWFCCSRKKNVGVKKYN